ncbi:pyridoxamine 5'-phosphate oxidase family protein [uncultured Algimonas sp.]|uniref:pyridoxamine 5'-phosphate oxidase family protein n=1 Tax=uncultured Algimonas sp. TaxID=1547920 RepID=UPI0026075A45|nr:pyridoxamine 5'-phosphate oxidase family protein [uncultured Algimonas sp.]
MSQSAETLSIEKLSKMMAKQDIAMLVTRHGDDSAVRPMSNNREVEFDGDTHFFTRADTTTVDDIKAHDRVSVTYQDTEDDTFIVLTGTASLHTDRDTLEEHWKDELSNWFEDGLETDGLTLVRVDADRVHYWIGRKEGELTL